MVESLEKVVETFGLVFPNELAIFQALWDERGDAGCPKCGNKAFQELRSGRCRRCTNNKCGHRRSVTANTWLHKVRNVRARLLALWINRNGLMYSANKMKSIVGKGYASTWQGEHASRWLNDLKLSEEPSVSIFRFVTIVARRTRQTPALKHARSELIEGFALDSLMTATADCPHADITISMMEHTTVPFSCAASTVEIAIDNDSNEQCDIDRSNNDDPDAFRNVNGDSAIPEGKIDDDVGPFIRSSSEHPNGKSATASMFNNGSKEQSVEESMIAKVCGILRGVFQTVSVKYMQLYIAHLLFRGTKNSSIQDMLKEVLNAPPFSAADLRMYASPRRCRLIPEQVLTGSW